MRHNEKLNRYEVSWVKEGKQGKTSTSIRKHGKEKAFELACRIRKEKEAERLGLKKPLSSRRDRTQAGATVPGKMVIAPRATKKDGEKIGAAPKVKPVRMAQLISAKPAPQYRERS